MILNNRTKNINEKSYKNLNLSKFYLSTKINFFYIIIINKYFISSLAILNIDRHHVFKKILYLTITTIKLSTIKAATHQRPF